MALMRFSIATSILLLSLLAIASATGDYGYGSGNPDQSYVPTPQVPKPKQPETDNTPKPKEKKPDQGYVPKPQLPEPKLPKPDDLPKPKQEKPDYGYGPTLPIAIEGLVLCKSGSKFVPIKGAVARIACLAEDEEGYETTQFSCLADETDASGYFFKTLPLYGSGNAKVKKYTECKAYLENSPLETCKVPTDVNNGIKGALLSSYRILNEKNIKLYSVGPFVCTSESNTASSGHY